MFRRLLIATLIGILAALAVAAFRHAMQLLEWIFLSNDTGSLVNAAEGLSPWRRLITPALGGLAAGLLLWGWQKMNQQRPHAPLAGSLFIAEILFGTLMLASLGPVVVSAVVALLTTHVLNGSDSLLYTVHLTVDLHAREYVMIVSTGLVAGLCGPLLMWLMTASHNSFLRLKLSPPWQLALGGLIVGLLSLLTPTVWGNGYSVVQSFLLSPPLFSLIGGIFVCKILAVLASSGSGAPGGVFTPTLFVGLSIGMFLGRIWGFWLPGSDEIAILLGLAGMATLLAATTHAPIMSTLMICEMTGEYQLLPGLLIACVVASVLSRTLRHDSIYRQHAAEH